MVNEEKAESALEKVARAIQEFVNEIDDQAPVILRGGVITFETMKPTADGEAVAFKVGYASLPNTSMAETIGTLTLSRHYALHDMMGEDDE